MSAADPAIGHLDHGRFLATLLCAGLPPAEPAVMVACFGIGLFSVAVQMLVAFVGSMAADADRGSVVGWITGALLTGLLAAWPVTNLVGVRLGWRGLYIAQAIAVGVSILPMANMLPARHPSASARYRETGGFAVVSSRGVPELRGHGLVEAFLFGAFSLFWTAVPLKLETCHLGRMQIASFGLIGGPGLLFAPIAGRAAVQGYGRLAGWIGIVLTATAFITSALFNSPLAFAVCAVLIGAGVRERELTVSRAAAGPRKWTGVC